MDLEKRCQEKWLELKINSPEDMKEYIKTLFEKHDNQGDVLIDLYRLVLPDWDNITMVNHSPEISPRLWEFICRQFIEFDEKHHPEVFGGGIWMNNGFSTNKKLADWEISFDNCSVTLV